MKYKLTRNTKMYWNIKLYQIEATKDFGDVKKWDLWGWIEKEDNLSQDGYSWVYDNAWVSDNSRVFDNASVAGNAWVFGSSRVSGNSSVSGNAIVGGKIRLDAWRCFASKEKDWNVSEIENEWIILLIKDHKPVKEKEVVELTVEEICDRLWYKEYKKIKKIKKYLVDNNVIAIIASFPTANRIRAVFGEIEKLFSSQEVEDDFFIIKYRNWCTFIFKDWKSAINKSFDFLKYEPDLYDNF